LKKGNQGTKPFIVVDCSTVAYAALYSYGHLSYGNEPTGIIFGFLSKLLIIAEKFETNRFVFCWDSKWTHRENDYPGYKEKRHSRQADLSPEDIQMFKSLDDQRNIIRKNILPYMGFRNNFVRPGYEADDLLAIWVRKLSSRFKVIMVTTDQDMYQCLDCCDIFSPQKKRLFTNQDLLREYNISACQWSLAKAIGGCSGDEVVGIYGAADPKSPKSKALKYLRGELTKGKIFDRIECEEGKAIIKKNLPIVTTPYRADEMKRMILRRDKLDKQKFINIFEQYDLRSFLKPEKFAKWKSLFL